MQQTCTCPPVILGYSSLYDHVIGKNIKKLHLFGLAFEWTSDNRLDPPAPTEEQILNSPRFIRMLNGMSPDEF